MAGEAAPVVGERLNLGQQSKSLGLKGIKEGGHTGLNLNQKGLRDKLKVNVMHKTRMNAADLH